MKNWWMATNWVGRAVALVFLGGAAFYLSESITRLSTRPDRAAALIAFALTMLVTGLAAALRLSSPATKNPFTNALVERAAFMSAGAAMV